MVKKRRLQRFKRLNVLRWVMHWVGASWKHFVAVIAGARDLSHSVDAEKPSLTFASRQERRPWAD